MQPNDFEGVGLDADAIERMGRRASPTRLLAWHYTSANSAKGILAEGKILPAFSPCKDANEDALKMGGYQKLVYFTVNDRFEPSIRSPMVVPRHIGLKIMEEGGGGWYRFGYPEHLLFPPRYLPLDAIPVETDLQILGRLGMRDCVPPRLRPFCDTQKVQREALNIFKLYGDNSHDTAVLRTVARLSKRDERVSTKPIALEDVHAIDSLNDDLRTWNRVWTNENTH
ncbi:hypothetical protein [Paraburkholderia bannensis]|jgi:hypothetical protein|uniref:hypothetical protein n=1 Tax=Paraburkholderia bannensis TaxID=765414 RepID=UPI002AC337E4|nr:hypothetical protein [Paraburkholderia bannensis]